MTVDTIEHKQSQFTQCRVLDGLLGLTLGCSFVTALVFVTIGSLKIINHLRGISHVFALDFSSELLLASALITLALMSTSIVLFVWSKYINARVKRHSR